MDTPTPDVGTLLLAWDGLTMPDHERSHRWYVVSGTIVVAIAAYGIITGGWSVTLVALLSAGMYYILKDHRPAPKHIEITTQGILFDGTFTAWADWRSFWIVQTPIYTELHVARGGKKTDGIKIQLNGVTTAQVRSAISGHIPEETEKHERLIDMIIRICKL